MAVELGPHQATQLAVADRHQSPQRPILARVAPGEEHRQGAAVHQRPWREPVGDCRHPHPPSAAGEEKVVEAGGIPHPKTVNKDLDLGLRTQTHDSAQPTPPEAHARGREVEGRTNRLAVDLHLHPAITVPRVG